MGGIEIYSDDKGHIETEIEIDESYRKDYRYRIIR